MNKIGKTVEFESNINLEFLSNEDFTFETISDRQNADAFTGISYLTKVTIHKPIYTCEKVEVVENHMKKHLVIEFYVGNASYPHGYIFKPYEIKVEGLKVQLLKELPAHDFYLKCQQDDRSSLRSRVNGYFQFGDKWIAFDNSAKEFFMEAFDSELEAKKYAYGIAATNSDGETF